MIDASVLFDVLVVAHLESDRDLRRNDRVASCLHASVRGIAAQRRMLDLLSSIRKKLTTSHAMGEINGLVKTRLDLREPLLSVFWNRAIDLLTQWDLDERLIRLLDLWRQDSAVIPRVGLVDAGLVNLAIAEGCPLITHDERALLDLAYQRGVDCRLLKNLLEPTA